MYIYVTFCDSHMTSDFLSLCSVEQNLIIKLVPYNRVILLSLNNTVEFFNYQRFDPKVFFSSIQKQNQIAYLYTDR